MPRLVLLCTLLTVAFFAMSGCSQKAGSNSSSSGKAEAALTSTKFRMQEIVDAPQGGMIAFRLAVPQDWKVDGHVEWHYNDLYTPMRAYARAEAPDGSAWMQIYPVELFYWLDPRWDNFKAGSVGGIHHTNISLQEAMQRYVIPRYRGKEKNLQILGYRPVKNLARALGKPEIVGEGIDFRIRYETASGSAGSYVDEEFFGLMTPVLTIPYQGPQGTTYEFHRTLALVHSLGARNGKLESMRPLLGYIARSVEDDKVWDQHQGVIMKQLTDAYNRYLAAGYAQIAAAGQLSRTISANNDAMIRAMDAQRAASIQHPSNPMEAGVHAAEEFDRYIRGTELVQDSSGQQSEQSSLYNYHWTDGFGTVVHSNDGSFDPNQHSNQPFEKMKPVK